jgi:hypothetical protein
MIRRLQVVFGTGFIGDGGPENFWIFRFAGKMLTRQRRFIFHARPGSTDLCRGSTRPLRDLDVRKWKKYSGMKFECIFSGRGFIVLFSPYAYGCPGMG